MSTPPRPIVISSRLTAPPLRSARSAGDHGPDPSPMPAERRSQPLQEGDAAPYVIGGAPARRRLGAEDRVLFKDIPPVIPGIGQNGHDPRHVDVTRAQRP